MRIPFRRVYRAFDDLDSFSDVECKRFVAAAQAQTWIGLWVSLAGIAGAALWALAGVVALRATGPGPRGKEGGLSDAAEIVLLVSTCAAAPLFVAVPAVLLRDRLLIRAIRNRLLLVRCPACRYSLLGLALAGDTVRCPECGAEHRLEALGLTAADLIPRATPAAPLSGE